MKVLWGIWISVVLINLAAILERADESLIPSVYKEIGQAFNATPAELGTLTFIRAVIQALFSPLAGVLALKYHRPSVIGLGTLFWAVSTAAVGLSQSFFQCALSRATNGIGLAIVIPAMQSYVADSNLEGSRGVAFGWLNFVGSVGGIGGSMTATILAGYTIAGLPGWRFVFLSMAILSSMIGILIHMVVLDPKEHGTSLFPTNVNAEKRLHTGQMAKVVANLWRETSKAVRTVLRVRTFQIIVLQGIVGSLPWSAMVFFTMWFELIGFGHKTAALLIGFFTVGCAFGALMGGWLGDKAAVRYPKTGRIMCAQFSSFMGIPFSWLLLRGLPQDPEKWAYFAITLLFMGLTISWCQACANNPMFASIVPPKDRTMIYAFDRAFEGSFAALAAPLVGILAERLYGYRTLVVISDSGSLHEADALSKGLLTMMALPFALCCLCYTPLYVTYTEDYKVAQQWH